MAWHGKSFRVVTGEYVLNYQTSMDYIEIYHKDAGKENGCLHLKPGGSDPDLGVLERRNIDHILVKDEQQGVTIEILGRLKWAKYETSIVLPRPAPGLINCSVELNVTKQMGPEENLFSDNHPELSYYGHNFYITPRLTYYLNGTPGALAYHSVNDAGAQLDYNQLLISEDEKNGGNLCLKFL